MKRGTRKLINKAVALLCAASMVFTGVVTDLGVMNVVAAEETAEGTEYRTEWNFRKGSELMGTTNGVVFNAGETGTFADLAIDASASTGKFDATRDDWAQVNAGTIITVPVAGSSKVTVTTYNAGTISVDGQVATAKTETFICAGTDNKVTIEYLVNDYIGSIKVEPYSLIEEGTIDFTTTNLADAAGVSATNVQDSGSGHGLQSKAADATLVLSLAQKANITVTACCYGAGEGGTMSASSGKVESTTQVEEEKNAPIFTVTGAKAGELTLTFASNMYIHGIAVEYVAETGTGDGDDEEKEYRTDWNFRKGSELMGTTNGVVFNAGETGTFADLAIDASAGTGKFDATRDDWAQVNAGTIITVPVAGSSKVTVTTYNAGTISVDGQVATEKTETFICAGTDNKVTIEYLVNDYIGSIKVEPYATVAEGTLDFSSKTHDITTVEAVSVTNMQDSASGHGLQSKAADATLVLSLAQKAKITVNACCYGVGAAGTMEASCGKVTSTKVEEDGPAPVFTTYAKVGGDVTLTFASNMYIHSVVVEYGVEDPFGTNDGDDEEEVVYRTEWDFQNDTSINGENGKTVQSTTEVVEVAGLLIDVSNGGKWNSTTTNGWVQTNNTTKITIPVEGSSKVSLVMYNAYYSVDGVAATAATETFICKGTDNKVVIEITGDGNWLRSIKVEPYATVAAGTTNFASAAADATWDGIVLNNIAGEKNSHGLHVGTEGGTMVLTLPEKANIVVEGCRYGVGNMTTSSGTIEEGSVAEGSDGVTAKVFTVLGANAGELTLTFDANMWIHNIFVEYIIEVGDRNIDVWDFGGLVETDTETYTNNITPDKWLATNVKPNSFPSASYAFGDLTLVPNSSDRLYTSIPELSALDSGISNFGKAQNAYSDGYTSAGTYYCNGSGGSSRRYVTIANVQAGDKIVAYMGVHGSSATTFYFEGLGAASSQKDAVECASGEYTKFEFVAEKTGTYKIWESGASKHLFHRVMRVPGVEVTGTITAAEVEGAYTGTEHGLKFVNQTTKQETEAVIDGSTFTVALAPGYTYTAVLTNAAGFGFTVDSRTVVTTDAESLTGKSDVALVIEPKELYTYSGKITGFADGYDVSKLAVTMTPPADSTVLPIELTIDENLNFTANLEPDVEYTIVMTGVNDYEVKSETVINKNEAYAADITVGLKARYAVSGAFAGLGENAEVTALTFTNVDDNYVYTATVGASGYSISLRDGSYLAKATVSGYSTKTHVVVDGAAVAKDLMFVSTASAPALDLVSDLYVGYADKANNYTTVGEAVAAAAQMSPSSEAERITIHIAPGTYREQIIVETPYISFVNDTDEDVVLTWYYGIDYLYYSASASGYYDPELAYDKFEKHGVNKWGATVYVTDDATAFRADNIIFENSFNRYLTEEELADGVEINLENSDNNTTAVRNYSLDVKSKAATERAAALVVEADKSEFKDCTFLGSQDTVMTGNAATKVYFKDCFLEGQTDYIFGSNTCIFDNCELSWYGYSTGSLGGYITAARPVDSSVAGYLFRNCSVTANSALDVTPGYFGRPWGADAKVMFLNTRLESEELITAAGWTSMSGATPEKANFYEYNTTDMSGAAVSTTGRITGTVADADTAATWTMAAYFGSWVPAFYTEEAATVEFATAPFVTDNGDINTPYPGHKLTVGYSLGAANDANDASRIEWYRVKEGVADVLVKASAANADKTYKITSDDIGYQIKVVVTPITVSGNTGTAASCTVAEVVRDGYEDPDAEGPDAVLGDGVNIFLAGDSTVKDYTAAGLNSGGKDRNEGAWGEYFQKFFNDEKVTVVNYANGGRSTRNFINEGSLDEIAEKISEGDYLFIQFGHNDCSDGAEYLADRYVPLGTPDANGVYPTTAGTKVTTPTALEGMGYGATCYTYDCGGTYKWYLLQYINVAKEAGAIPVLVTPVSRMYYNSDGTIKAHHDSSETSNNAYVTAVKQLAEEQNVLLVDGFEITKKLFEDAYTACGSDAYGKQIMHTGDKTHNNKLGGVIEAAAIVSAVQNMELNISYAVKAPAQVMGVTTESQTVFTINSNSVLTAYDISSDYVERATYWEGIGQDMIDDIAEKAAELAGGEQNPDDGNKPGTDDGNDKPGTDDGNKPGTGDGNDKPGTGDGNDKPGTGDGNDKPGTGDGNDKPVNTEGLKIEFANPGEEYEYTGSAIKPEIIVTNNGEELVAGVDYTVKYSNNVKATTTKKATITVKGKGNITGSTSETFEIQPKDIADADVIEGSVVVVKNAKATPILVYNNKKLGTKDYTNPDAKKKFAEDGVITITGKGNFTGTREIDVKVVDKKDLKKFTVTVGKEKLTYNGEEQIPTITVADKASKAPLTENIDYIIVYGGSTANAGTVKFTVIGLGIYSGTVAKSYKISPLAVKDGMKVTGVDEDGYGFSSKGVTIGEDLTVTYEATGDVLTEGKDYKISYSGNKKVGTAKYTIKFQGNYKGSKALKETFTIVPAGLTDATDGLKIVLADQISKGKPNVYKSKPIVDIDGVTLKASNYTVEYYKDAALSDKIDSKNKVDLGADPYTTIYVKIVGKGNYAPVNGEYATAEYKVYSKDGYKNLSKARVTFVDDAGSKLKKLAYTGEELEPNVKVEYKDGKTWVEVPADQYEVSYTNNVNKGKATVVVTGTGDQYAGSKTAKISIVALSLKDVKDLWKNLF